MSAPKVSCHHCEGWGCTHCQLERQARAGGEQGLTAAELEFEQMREERDAALKQVAELKELAADEREWNAQLEVESRLLARSSNEWMRHILGAEGFNAHWGPTLEAFGRGVDELRAARVLAERERDAWHVRCLKVETALHEAREDRDEAQRAAAWAQKERDAALAQLSLLSKGGAA